MSRSMISGSSTMKNAPIIDPAIEAAPPMTTMAR